MPVQLNSIKGLATKRVLSTDIDIRRKEYWNGFNEALSQQGQVKIGLNGEKLTELLYQIRSGYSIGEAQPGGCNSILMLKCANESAAIIAKEHEILERSEE